MHQKQDRCRSAPGTGQILKCTKNGTNTEVHQKQAKEVHQKQDRHRSAPETEQTHKCTRNRTSREHKVSKVYQKLGKQRGAL